MPQLINTARGDATYGALQLFDTSRVSVEIPSLRVYKSADMERWIGDELTYIIIIKNIEETGGQTATAVKLTDNIDLKYATLVDGSVEVNGTPLDPSKYTFDTVTGLLTIPLNELAPQEEVDISFRVEKV